jgi:hypothetical protein
VMTRIGERMEQLHQGDLDKVERLYARIRW